MELKGSQTEKNLLMAFAGESQARNRYDFFSSAAKKEGLQQIAGIFEETAKQEKEHAERFFSFLKGGSEIEITAAFPAGEVKSTLENLKAAAHGENEEWTTLYPQFAKIAREEGFNAIAKCFDEVSVAEKHHEARYLAMYNALVDGKMFKRDSVVIWRCRNCGYIHEGLEAPKVCPACLHAQAYFEVAEELVYNK